jgi:response regulator RpfG family c-di-GMP phosphodiesterase
MSEADRVLVVDDDTKLLAGLERHLGQRFAITTAENGPQALERIKSHGPFAVILCDMRMPGMDGIEVLKRFAEQAPDTVRMMLTGNADQKTAAEAINDGRIFRFFSKPCPAATLAEGIDAAIRQFRLVMAERKLLEQTLAGSVKMLAEVLSLVAPETFERSVRLRTWALQVGRQMGLSSLWELELAASLVHVGAISVPVEVLARHRSGQSMSPVEANMIRHIPQIGAELIRKIPRLETVAQAVLHQGQWFNGEGGADGGPVGHAIPVASRILHALIALDDAGRGRLTREVLAVLDYNPGRFDPAVVAAARACLHVSSQDDESGWARLTLPVHGVKAGDLIETNLELESGKLIFAAGQTITHALFVRLTNLQSMYQFREPVRVRRMIGVD